MTLLVRDEQDIVADNIEFHLANGVDYILATDNLSEDATPDILQHYANQGVLSWRRETNDDYSQYLWVTRMAREASTVLGADWVINNDADEFWWAADGDLKGVLTQVGEDVGGLVVPRVDYLVRPDENGPFWDRMTVRQRDSVKLDGKPLPPKVVHRGDPMVEVVQGNHAAAGPTLGPLQDTDRMLILHYPMRSYVQFANKIEKGGRAYSRNSALSPSLGRRWRTLYERHKEGTLRQWYDEQILDSAAIQAGVDEGRYVVDGRLRDWFRQRPGESGSSRGSGMVSRDG